jgi:dTDP-4-dehydrorhamnose 3,5-epimerase
MKISQTGLPGILLMEPNVFGDERGFFLETYREIELINLGIPCHFVQDNHSGSRQGVLRGLHYQINQQQGKLIRVVRGEIFDVAVDIRVRSTTFGQWVGMVISEQNRHQLWIPAGFAHGYYVLSEWSEIIYKVTDYYSPEWERTLLWNDPEIGIKWPILPGTTPILSERDARGLLLGQGDFFV